MKKWNIRQVCGLMLLLSALTVSVSSTPLAPGYCSSSGGSTTYEYISGVNYTKNPSGTMVLTVEVFIANPTGCAYGDPCPEYDNSPEYVNAWVDWDGDNVWETHERVIDENLTGYHDLNYYGTMTTSAIFTIPNGSVNTTWARVNLGWSHDPNDPCELSWTWGDVFDEQVSTETELPQIEDIVVTGPPGEESNPMTTFPVTLEAVTSAPTGFVITSISWSGDGIPAGATGSPYTYTPAAGTHGNKNIQCTITWEKTATGEAGEDTMTKGYKLFFDKDGDEDTDGEPNWFEHWASDGAVPRLGETTYSPTLGGYGCFGCTGTLVEISPSAAGQHYSSAIVLNTYFGTESFGGPSVTGIDCAAEVVAHEFYHKWVWQNWQTGGDWAGDTDSDDGLQAADCDDNLPDWYENTVSHTWNNDTDTYDLEHKKHSQYRKYGDNEYMAMRTGSATKGDPAKDWANPGKQTTPAYDVFALDFTIPDGMGPLKANFTGANSDIGVDVDGDGLFDFLNVTSEVEVTNGGLGNVVAVLMDNAGNEIAHVNKQVLLENGTKNISVSFDGVSIWKYGFDGKFNVSIQLNDEFDYPNEVDWQYFYTSPYMNEDFEEQSAEFANKFTEYVVDTDFDKLYNYLIIYAGVYARTGGFYTVEGWLHDSKENEILMASNTTYLSPGFQYVALMFDGHVIRQHRMDGPFMLRYLKLVEDSEQIDFMLDAHTTDDYPYKMFQLKGAELTGSYESWGKDPNGNKFYDYLTIAVGVNVQKPGKYTVLGELFSENGTKIGEKSVKLSTKERGQTYVELDFLGKEIFLNGEDGPYNLKHVFLIGENGIIDEQHNAHYTSPYDVGMFRPLILLSDAYVDKGEDSDGDGLYDNLTICAAVFSTDDGKAVLSARIMDKNKEEIIWARETGNVTGCVYFIPGNTDVLNSAATKGCMPSVICMKFDGEDIAGNMVDGPYRVNDVFVYHTGDVYFPDYSPVGHKTAAYSYLEFEMPGVVTGKVTDVDGNPVPNTVVKIEGVDYDYADSEGKYKLIVPTNGTYNVVAEPPPSSGLLGDSALVTVVKGELTVQDFMLTSESQLKNRVYLNPDPSWARYCSTRDVEIRANAEDFQAGQIELLYDQKCADVTNFARNAKLFPFGGWDSSTSGREWITFSAEKGLTGDYLIGTLTIHCVDDSCECKTELRFGDESALFNPFGEPIPAFWKDGEFQCRCFECGDVNCDGKINMGDVILLLNHVTYGYPVCDLWSADTICTGDINMGDVVLLLNHVTYGYKLKCCPIEI